MKVTHAPFKYYGSKFAIADWIISFFPPHNNYVEPCGGSASVLLRKRPSPLETFNDLDKNVVNFFEILRDRTDELIEKVRLTPYARYEHEICRQPSEDPLENARRFFVSSWMSISCMPFDKGTGMRTASYSGQNFLDIPLNFRDAQERLWAVAERFRLVQIENRPADYVIGRYDHPDTLTYFDPPYVSETRSNRKMYAIEWSDADHARHAYLLREAMGYAVVSGYACELYRVLYEEHGWRRFDKEAQTNSGSKRVESIWLSPRTVKDLNRPQQYSIVA
jgi:DNA adenine methylase